MKKTAFDLVNDIFYYYTEKYSKKEPNAIPIYSLDVQTRAFEIPLFTDKLNPFITLTNDKRGKDNNSTFCLFRENNMYCKMLEISSTFEGEYKIHIKLEDWIGGYPAILFRENDKFLSNLRIAIIQKTNKFYYSRTYKIDC